MTKGFTLVELLVVIAIVSILATVVVLYINPSELLKRGSDATRLKDLESLQTAINFAIQDGMSNGKDVLCNNFDFPCFGKSNLEPRVTDGSGWVKVNLSSKSVSLVILPIDPLNNSEHHYIYCADNNNWEINAALESEQQGYRMAADGGNEMDKYEVGSNYLLLASDSGVCEF